MKSYSELKHDLFQVLGTALAVAAVVVPLLQWGIDAKLNGFRDIMAESDKRWSERIDEMDERWLDHQTMYERVLDERMKSRNVTH